MSLGGGGLNLWHADLVRFLIVAAVSGPTRSCGQHQQRVRPTAAAADLEPQPDGRGHRVDDQPPQQRYLQQHIRGMIWKVERQRQAEQNDIRRLLLSRDLSEGTELEKCRLHWNIYLIYANYTGIEINV
jgi:hypothetical protein